MRGQVLWDKRGTYPDSMPIFAMFSIAAFVLIYLSVGGADRTMAAETYCECRTIHAGRERAFLLSAVLASVLALLLAVVAKVVDDRVEEQFRRSGDGDRLSGSLG